MSVIKMTDLDPVSYTHLDVYKRQADYWFKYVGLNGAIVGMTTFGESAPAELLFEEFGFTVDNVVAKAKELL